MGQSTSRQRPIPDNDATRIDTSRISPPVIQRDGEGRPIRSDNLLRRRPLSEASAPGPSQKRTRRESEPVSRTRGLGILGLRSQLSESRRPSTASHANGESSPSSPLSLKKRWRHSRRWSRAPEALNEPIGHDDDVEMENGDREVPQGYDATRREGHEVAGSSAGTQTHSSRPSTPFPVSRSSTPRVDHSAEHRSDVLTEEERRLSQNIGAWLGGSPSAPVSPHSSQRGPPSLASVQREDEIDAREDIPREQDPREPEARRNENANPETDASSAPEPQPSPARAARAFGAPGTLVVVQGVVNAQDPARNSSNSQSPLQTARSSTRPSSHSTTQGRSSSAPRVSSRSSLTADDRSGIRNRLSSFIRPSSMLGGRGQAEDASPQSISPNPDASDDLLSENTISADAPASVDSESGAQANASSTSAQSDGRIGRGGLSPASIDVLGTLLSVAATATAASLFTPIAANASAANSVDSSASPTTAPPPISRPLSPTPTSGLGALGALGGLGLNSPSPATAVGASQDSRERIRNVWESIRERVGLNTRPNTGGAAPGTDASAGASEPRTMRSGEAMLADMARALNAGLGLTEGENHADGTQTSIIRGLPAPSATDASRPPPAEGTFERFLLNLQSDLRTMLSEDNVAGDSDEDSSQDPSTSNSSSSTRPTSSSDQGAGLQAVHDPEASLSPGSSDDAGVHIEQEAVGGEERRPPSLATVSDDVESEFFVDASDQHETEDEPVIHPRVPTPIPSMWTDNPAYLDTRERVSRSVGTETGASEARAHSPSTPSGNGGERERNRPAINLWRLYRFAPIPASQALENASVVRAPQTRQSQSDTDASRATPAFATTGDMPHAQPTSRARATDATSGDATTQTTTDGSTQEEMDATPNMPSVVVPVIVVGLQSVDAPMGDDEDDGVHLQEPSEAATSQTPPDSPLPWPSHPPTASAAGSNSRSWGSRAANALRGLRPGARRASRNGRATDNSGSRTFLIYVIGGYYPPWHDMVTGSDRLDSYEALWELAEILGQVKPPTASKEDIDNSGLQIIHASDLSRYESEGKVASNCVERCLVCLDDYEPEDELRVMSCRHTFHKSCVDKWLQVGRNNCPACRTTGVSSAAPSPPTPTMPDPPQTSDAEPPTSSNST